VLKVGLTGNVASGKSAVARVWQEMGATVVDADQLAREAVAPGTPGLARIVAQWGTQVLAPDRALDRAALREIVFRDPEAKTRLEQIVHPEVVRLRDVEYRAAEARGESLIVADIPLLFEVGIEDDFDVVVLVEAPEELRLERMVRERGVDPDTARYMIASQMPSEQKRSRAHYVIANSGSFDELQARAREVWHELVARAGVPAGG
jgi:dephospho-CoA kinase